MKVTLKRLESKNHIYFDEDIDEILFESTNFSAESYDTPPDLDQIDAYHVTSISM